MIDRFKFRIPMFTDKGTFTEFQYIELGDEIECTLCGYNGEPQQCTGLKDKNGTLIYEGDIVIEHYHNTKETATKKVFYDKIVIGFAYTDDIEYNQLCITDGHRLQVIGNIYENKSLLESEE